MNQKNIMVTRSSMPLFEEYINEIKSLWETHWLTNMGEKHQRLASELRAYLGVDEILLFTNGHNALELTLQAMQFPVGAEVITTPFTFASTTHAIVRAGLKPVFCDINADDYTIDTAKIENLITEKTVCILPVHVYGNLCDVDAIQEIAFKHNLKVIYDAAHAFGVKKDGIGVGNFGDAAMFSFHATKVYNTIEGGAVCLRDSDLATRLNEIKNFGIKNEEEVSYVGSNAKMNEFCAAMGLCNLRHVDADIIKRGKVVSLYRDLLKAVNGIKYMTDKEGISSNYAYFPIRVNAREFGLSRDDLYEELKKNGVFTRKYFYPITNSFSCYEGMFDINETPVALKASNEVLTLPLYPELSEQDIVRICTVIKNCSRKK